MLESVLVNLCFAPLWWACVPVFCAFYLSFFIHRCLTRKYGLAPKKNTNHQNSKLPRKRLVALPAIAQHNLQIKKKKRLDNNFRFHGN